jgi:hypothetical protein
MGGVCLRCGRQLTDANANYGWRCAEKVGVPYGSARDGIKQYKELYKLYSGLLPQNKVKFDGKISELLDKAGYQDTAIEAGGIYMELLDELAGTSEKDKIIQEILKGFQKNVPVQSIQRISLKKSVSKNKADNIIKDNAQYIIDAANEFGVNPAILASCIYAEQSLNVTPTETLEDWAQMMLGMDASVGVSQVRISTAKNLEDMGYIESTGEKITYSTTYIMGQKVTKKNVVSREEGIYNKLSNNQMNIRYAAAELKYRQDMWKDEYPIIDGKTDILATLYNLGDNAKKPNANPESNPFGNFAKENYYHMRDLLGLD